MNVSGSAVTTVAGATLHLLPHRAAWWEQENALLVADVHVGKAAAFRAAGVPVPAGTTRADLSILSDALDRTGARRLIVLGDLLHAREGRAPGTLAAVADWRARRPDLAITLVRGNHDRRAGPAPEGWHIDEHTGPLRVGPFDLRHEPPADQGANYTLAGHVHPSVRLRAADGDSLRAPCFVFGERAGLLPAFGRFTGTARIRPRAGDRVFVIGPDAVVAVRGH